MARILIAEHNKSTASYLYNALKPAGNVIDTVDNCLEAWRAISFEDYDVLLVDIAMPGIDSFVLAQKAVEQAPHIDIIFITGFAGVAMDSFTHGGAAAHPVTNRPFHLKDIAAHVRYLTGGGAFAAPHPAPHPTLMADKTSPAQVIYADFSRKPTTAPLETAESFR